ncbi:MAG: hypothetical protein Q8O47_09095 [Candidatus Bathyarchaeota archaeon]|nr:hypothetical protein [Candidatus Bathyarchaeota archaeon]
MLLGILADGTLQPLILLAVLVAATYVYNKKAYAGEIKADQLREIPAIAAITEGVGKSVEENKPVHYAMGASGGQLYSQLVSMTLVALAFLNYIAKLCAKYEAQLIVHMPYQAESIPLIEAMVREGYKAEGKPEAFQPSCLRYYGQGALSWTQAVTASYDQEGVGLNLSIGIFYSDCPISLEMAKIKGGMNVGGTGRWIMVYAFAMMCDYVFLGQEIYVAGAIISENPLMLAGVWIEDLGKFYSLLLLGVGLIVGLLGVSAAAALFAL